MASLQVITYLFITSFFLWHDKSSEATYLQHTAYSSWFSHHINEFQNHIKIQHPTFSKL